uniref:VWFA domain-containing protein n=1 Tax=Eutreptiella gymnastica TaxID=73025 RepID=A0A7S4GHC7_9EUGL
MEEKMGVDLDGDGVVGRPGGKPSSSDDGDSHHGLMGAMGAAAGLWAMSSGDSESESDDDHTGAALLAAGAVGLGGLAFFYAMNRKKKRDYVVVVDASCSMQSGVFQPPGGTRWSETHNAIRSIAAGACGADPDGLTLYFFNDQVSKFETVKREEDVDSIFQRYYPSGFTDLTAALEAAFAEHFGKHKKRPTTMLVIHDGEPNNPESTKQSLRNAANRMQSKKELAVSFVQVGDDPQATAFLETLDVGLGTKWDIVDKMHARDLQGQSFSDAVKQSIG